MFELSGKLQFHSLPQPDLSKVTREELRVYFENTYDLDETLFYGITDEEAFYKCPDRLRLPLVFYVAHPAAVFVNKMMLAGLIKDRVNPEFECLFETGVDEMSWDDTENYRMGGAFKWPSMKAVYEYRRRVREVILNVIDTVPIELPILENSPLWAIVMGTEHERIHLETSSVLIRQLPLRYLKRPEGWKYGPNAAETEAGENTLVSHPGGRVTYGKPRHFPTYGWDNEYGTVTTDVPAFEVSKYPITNREFLAFVTAGGYQNKSLWTEEGWRWVQFRKANHPTFWVCQEGCKSGCGSTLGDYTHCHPPAAGEAKRLNADGSIQYQYRTIYDNIAMPWDWPIDANYHEAKAFCKWKGAEYRLLTEAEHQILRDPSPATSELDYARDYVYSKDFQANLHLKYGSSTPVNLHPPNKAGVYDLHGNVWQWVEDHFNGLPTFKTNFLYDDFSTPCFDSRHSMILGGSFISTGDEASIFARFSFRRHFFQHCGFRIVRSHSTTPVRLVNLTLDLKFDLTQIPNLDTSSALVPTTNCQYNFESNDELRKSLLVNYGAPELGNLSEVVTKYHHKLAEIVRDNAPNSSSVFVVGAATGAVPFTIAKDFFKVVASDYCGAFVTAAMTLQGGESLPIPGSESSVTLPSDVARDRIIFKQLTWCPQELNLFPTVIIHEYLERTMRPHAWLVRLREVVSSHGIAVITSRGDWGVNELSPFLKNDFDNIVDTSLVAVDASSTPTTVTTKVTVWRKNF